MKEKYIRIFKRKRVFFLLVVLIFINIMDFLSSNIVKPTYDVLIVKSAWNENMMFKGMTSFAGIASSIIVFFLSGIPLADVFVEDKKSSYVNNAIIGHGSYDKYIWDNYKYNFLFAGFFLLIPFLINMLIWLMIMPIWPMNFINSGMSNRTLFRSLFSKNTIVFYILHFIKIFLAGGVLASFIMYLNTKMNSQYLGIIGMILIDFLIGMIFGNISSVNSSFELTSFTYLIGSLQLRGPLLSLIYYSVVLLVPIIYFKNYAKKIIIWQD